MIDMHVITGSGYHVNPKSLGFRTCTYIGVKLEKGSMYRDVVPELEKIPEVVECHFTTGPYTMLCKLYARDNEHLMELLNDKIQHIKGVVSTETLISLEQSMNREIPVMKEVKAIDFPRGAPGSINKDEGNPRCHKARVLPSFVFGD